MWHRECTAASARRRTPTVKGFNYPLTPKGKSTLNPRPPWYYSADFLNIEFWAEPSAVAALLPAGLDPDLSAKGHCNALFYDWQFSGDNEEYLDPARYQYREFFILVDALYAGKPVAYCPYIFVDNDAALARGWTQGYPKRLGQVFQTRYHAATGKAGPALAPGSKFAGSLTAGGQRLAQGVVTLREPVDDPSQLKERPVVNLLHYPRLAAEKQDKPAIHELVENVPHSVKIEQAWRGEGSLTLPVCRGEEISDLAPVRCGKGIRASMAYVVDDLRTLKDLRK
ncbi:MAG: acetoacetate decarboxylase [Chloroflexi bacterium]|nr:MAG: acetoacetate decarboxylase [Chloroflexota bacterium]